MNSSVLNEIDEQLGSEEVAAIKFLCRDHIPRKKMESVRDGRDLFLRLEEQGLLSEDGFVVKELLFIIKRWDLLLKYLHTSRSQMEEHLRAHTAEGISPYRRMLYELSEYVTEENLTSMKFLLNIPRSRQQACRTFLDLLVEMENQDMLAEDNLEELDRICSLSSKQLSVKLRKYMAGGSSAQHKPYQKTAPRPIRTNFNSTLQPLRAPLAESLHASPLSTRTASTTDLDQVYDMSHRPRGHCLIISNFNFTEARTGDVSLQNRPGTDKDEDSLMEIFSQLHFEVNLRKDLTGNRILETMQEFSKLKQDERDAFVCCVLSHGHKGTVYGTDGNLVSIREITQPFTSSRCPSLAGKPKLFFIQACQGRGKQQGVSIQADGEEEHFQADTEQIFDDAVPETIPDDSDFLLSMATVEDYKSYRSVSKGSIFIQELCRQLKSGCARNEDILTILTKVNRGVSSGVYLSSKQMPEPRYTLTKKLFLPFD